ncbi:MAG: CoxG family protein [Anaerolineales bacterium]
MLFEGIVNINASRDKVWAFLTDPDFVSQCAPGLKSMEVVEPDKKFKAVAAVGFGTVKVTFTNEVEFLELEKPNRAKVKAHGTAPGSAVDAVSEMILSDAVAGTTDLKWTADITVVGTIASLASRLMSGVTKKLTGEFFECVRSRIEG